MVHGAPAPGAKAPALVHLCGSAPPPAPATFRHFRPCLRPVNPLRTDPAAPGMHRTAMRCNFLIAAMCAPCSGLDDGALHTALVLAQCISGMLLHYWLAVSGRVHFCQVDTIWSALHCVALHYSTLAVTGVWSPFIKGHDCMHLFVFIIVITLDDVGFLSECSIILCNVWPLNPCYAQCWPVSFCVQCEK